MLNLIESTLGWTPAANMTPASNLKKNVKSLRSSALPIKASLPSEYASIDFFVSSDDPNKYNLLPVQSILSESSSSIRDVKRLPLNQITNTRNGSNPDLISRFAEIEGHLVSCGMELIDIRTAHTRFIVTPTIRQHLRSLARVLSGGRVPVLLEGPTSAGKSSLVKFICHLTGHHFVRINNHEHTDLQEYLGQHVTDPNTGQLVFVEGAIAQAARKGHWVVLDELNLASSEVLEGRLNFQ